MSKQPSTRTDQKPDVPEFDSQVMRQLREGFPLLRFEQPLEKEFRAANLKNIRSQMRINLWLATSILIGFIAIGHVVLDQFLNDSLDRFRVMIVLPALLCGLAITYTRYYGRYFSALVQLLAPLFGISVLVESMIAARLGVSLFAAVVLTIIGMYLLVGQLFYAALRSAAIVFVAYMIGAPLLNMPSEQAAYNFVVLLATNAVGATVCYSLEKAQRTNFLESRLLTEMASRDGLTGIYNRRMLDEHLEKVWYQAGRERAFIGLLLIDIDHFKNYNDYCGHQAGDQCLRQVARVLTQHARRPLDFAGRYGGEEFAVVLYDARRDYVEELANRLRLAVEGLNIEHPSSSVGKHVTISIGAAWVLAQPNRSWFGLVQLADEALYDAKSTRNRVVLMDKEYEQMMTGSFRSRRKTAAAG